MLEEHLKKLAMELKLPPFPSKEKNSSFEISLPEDLSFSIKLLKPGFFLFAQVAPVPTQKTEALFTYCMKGNLLGQGTGNQVLGLDFEEKFLTLSRSIPYDMDYKDFKESIEDFANHLNYWREEIKKLQKIAEESIL